MPVLPCRTEKALSFSLWFFPQWLLTIFDQIDVSSFARIFTFVLQFKTLKTPLACTLLIHPTVSLPDYFPTQLWTSRMLFGRGGRDRAKQFLLPRSILTGKLFHSSDVRRHFNLWLRWLLSPINVGIKHQTNTQRPLPVVCSNPKMLLQVFINVTQTIPATSWLSLSKCPSWGCTLSRGAL